MPFEIKPSPDNVRVRHAWTGALGELEGALPAVRKAAERAQDALAEARARDRARDDNRRALMDELRSSRDRRLG